MGSTARILPGGWRTAWGLSAAAAVGAALWFLPAPPGLEPRAWHLFAVFLATILSILLKALPLFTASVLGGSFAILSGVLKPEEAFAGFGEEFLVLIVAAFLMARAVMRSGLGTRIALLIIRSIGGSALGLSYSMVLADAAIAPAFPSNTARSGVLFPVFQGLCEAGGSLPDGPTRRVLGHYLMMSGIASLSLSSSLWLTAMAANPLGAQASSDLGIPVTFGSWALAASLPTAVAMALVPWVLLKVARPEKTRTPDAPRHAARELAKMGPLGRAERICGVVFGLMVAGWLAADLLNINRPAVALAGLGILMVTGAYSLADLFREGEVLSVWVWFGFLFAMSAQLNKLGFMGLVGGRLAEQMRGWSPALVYLGLVLSYVAMHYLFVSQTAHMLALFGVFLSVGLGAGVNGPLLAHMLLFATNFFSAITPQGSSANVLFAGSGYLTHGELYGYGALVTALNTAVFLAVGTPWIWLVCA